MINIKYYQIIILRVRLIICCTARTVNKFNFCVSKLIYIHKIILLKFQIVIPLCFGIVCNI